jgi:FdrA protein
MERHDCRHCRRDDTGIAVTTAVRRHVGAYHDSMRLMAASRTLSGSPGVSWGVALMGTPPNLEVLAGQGVDAAPAHANDLILAVRADSADHAEDALDAAEAMLAGGPPGESGRDLGAPARPRTIAAAATVLTGANVAVVSVPGPYAALAAQQALSAGLHVLLFSDGVSVDDEAWLKTRAEALGLLVMGPGAGTAVLGGVGLGFANVVPPGPVGVVAAAGTGAQEILALLSAAGTGVAAVIGVGGRDLTRAVGGRMTASALRALAGQPDVKVLILVSKPPDPDVLAAILPAAGDTPLVVVAQGATVETGAGAGVRAAGTIDDGVEAALTGLGLAAPDLRAGLRAQADAAIRGLDPARVAVRGVFSGGTLCYQAMLVLSQRLGPVFSNTPLQPGWRVPAPPGGHVCIDAGEEEFTASRPHPMIDAEARVDLLREAGSDPATAVLLLDVVLGHGAHPDPAGILAPVLADLAGPAVVAHVLGTDGDPQGLAAQRAVLAEAGCLIAPSGARAALLAAAIARRDAALAEESP